MKKSMGSARQRDPWNNNVPKKGYHYEIGDFFVEGKLSSPIDIPQPLFSILSSW
jgi:hypothetical protein